MVAFSVAATEQLISAIVYLLGFHGELPLQRLPASDSSFSCLKPVNVLGSQARCDELRQSDSKLHS